MFRRAYRSALLVGLCLTGLLMPPAWVEAQNAQGIEVHGHWKIEVLDAQGSLVRTTEFENDLGGGAVNLAALLGRTSSQGLWSVHALGTTSPCADGACNIREPGGNPAESNDLTLTVSGGSLILSGSFVAEQDGDISSVQTGAGQCAGSVAPDTCTNEGGPDAFSIASGLTETVVGGQIVQITVTFTFS